MGKMMNPKHLPKISQIPDALIFADGREVETLKDWEERKQEIKSLYEYYMYGPLPGAAEEVVTWKVGEAWEADEEVTNFDGTKIWAKARCVDLTIEVAGGEKKTKWQAIATLPLEKAPGSGYPVHVEMCFVFGENAKLKPTVNAYYAASRGYATIDWEPVKVAADHSGRQGAFYEVHPYGTDWTEQTGVLAAWGWGASKILDALEQGLDHALQIDAKNSILSGVSRYGKATLVAGAYDSRFKVVVPACSGAGGVALYRCNTEGNVYDLKELGYVDENDSSFHTTTQNEPLGSLQSTDERHWFNDVFLEFDSVEQFPVDQHQLAGLIADENRYLFIIASAFGEDWTNPAAMYETYKETCKINEFLNLRDHICMDIHLKGHAVLVEDMEKILDFCDVKLYGKSWSEVKTKEKDLNPTDYCKWE